MTKLWNTITAGGHSKPYGMTDSQELAGKIPEGSAAVKCSDDLFLVKTDGRLKLYSKETEVSASPDIYQQTDEADGFRTEISLAPDVILPAAFSAGGLTLGEEGFTVTVRKVQDKMLLLEFEEGDAILFDTSRFLLYAFVDGEFLCGYVEV
ncbi:MAG: hypothetical protein J5744_08810 [Oscillospiraceae bacterium]|nr:hypothetical protein [Oscillospiraceae bacterium]